MKWFNSISKVFFLILYLITQLINLIYTWLHNINSIEQFNLKYDKVIKTVFHTFGK